MGSKTLRFYITWLSILQYGVILGIETSFISVFSGNEQFDETYGHPTSFEQGIMTAIYLVFAAVGSSLSIPCATKFDKKTIIILATVLWIIGFTVSVTLLSFVHFVIGRSIKGMAIGLLSSLLPLYITEVFLDTHVSYVLTSYQSALPFGIFFNALVVAVGFGGEKPLLKSFNYCWLVSALPVSSVLFTCFFIRVSPFDLLKSKKQKKLYESVEEVYGNEKLKEAIDNLSIQATKTNLKSDVTKLFTTKSSAKRLLYATLPQIMVQMTGINILMYYITYICQMAGQSPRGAMTTAIALYFCNFLFNSGSICVVRFSGRVPMLRYGCLVLGLLHAITFMLMTTGHEVPPINGNPSAVWTVDPMQGISISVTCFAFVITFSLTVAGAGMVYTAEMVPQETKPVGMGVAITIGWIVNFVMSTSGPLLLATLKHYTFLLFALFCLFSYLLSSRFVETRNSTESYLQGLFDSPHKETSV